ncbi:MAG: hypothetical protein J6K90_05200 [Tidjanibacter sp.]|nr:hypothetical protein [Tidjanibacter sp.]MBR6831065.1 hypothetical protein [Tidjanibacter sp.]
MNKKLIDKQIYKLEQVGKKLNIDIRYLLGIVISTAFLALAKVPFVAQSDWLNAICVAIGWCGAAGLVSMILYVLIGDCHRLFLKTTGSEMERCEVNFEAAEINTVAAKLESGDFQGLLSIPRSFSPNYLLVVYRSQDNGIVIAQLVDNSGLSQRPLTDIKIYEKGESNFPDNVESLTRFFY